MPQEEHYTRHLQQTYITDYYGATAEQQRRLAAQKAQRERYNTVRRYRRKMHKEQPYTTWLASIKGYCYCRISSHFIAIDPRLDISIAELDLDNDFWLEHIHVESDYQRQGIGLNMIKLANQYTYREGASGINVCVGLGENSRYRLSDEGAALISACVKRGILQYYQVFYESVPSPHLF